MKTYRISRVFAERMEWIVEAENEKQALEMLDDDDKTPSEAADTCYLGSAMFQESLEDEVEAIDDAE